MRIKISVLALLPIFFLACSKNASVLYTNIPVNLVANPSFETAAHHPDYNNWSGTVYITDSLGNQNPPLVQDAPEGGGKWCVELHPLWMPSEGYTAAVITGQAGTNTYRLTAWMKTIYWHGSVALEHWRKGHMIGYKMVADTAAMWKQVSLLDTLALLSDDWLKIHLSAGSTEVASGKARFDNIILEKINPGK